MIRCFLFSLIFLILLFQNIKSSHNILDYGALPHQDIISVQFANTKAFIDATMAANNSQT